MEYPYTIIFRVGLMYSLFILFLVNVFIKWWLDNSQVAKHTKKMVIMSTIALMAYALFVSTVDRKRIDFVLAERAVFVSCITNFFAISLVMSNLSAIRWNDPKFIKFFSWKMKKAISWVFYGGMIFGLLIYLGQVDIEYKAIAEYIIVISTYLFYWSFVLDFSKYEMDVEQSVKFPCMLNDDDKE